MIRLLGSSHHLPSSQHLIRPLGSVSVTVNARTIFLQLRIWTHIVTVRPFVTCWHIVVEFGQDARIVTLPAYWSGLGLFSCHLPSLTRSSSYAFSSRSRLYLAVDSADCLIFSAFRSFDFRISSTAECVTRSMFSYSTTSKNSIGISLVEW